MGEVTKTGINYKYGNPYLHLKYYEDMKPIEPRPIKDPSLLYKYLSQGMEEVPREDYLIKRNLLDDIMGYAPIAVGGLSTLALLYKLFFDEKKDDEQTAYNNRRADSINPSFINMPATQYNYGDNQQNDYRKNNNYYYNI